jgi:hypothetical protein
MTSSQVPSISFNSSIIQITKIAKVTQIIHFVLKEVDLTDMM